MGDILFAGLDALIVGAQVVVLLGKAKSTLIDVGNLAGGVFEILH